MSTPRKLNVFHTASGGVMPMPTLAHRETAWIPPMREDTILPCTLGAMRGRDWWFTGGDDKGGRGHLAYSVDTPEIQAARMGCQLCPVRTDCLEDAIVTEWGQSRKARHGIWGGLNPVERVQLELARQWAGFSAPDSEERIPLAS